MTVHQVDHRGTRPLGRLDRLDPSGQASRPPTLETATRHDKTPMTPAERHLRDQILRHLAA